MAAEKSPARVRPSVRARREERASVVHMSAAAAGGRETRDAAACAGVKPTEDDEDGDRGNICEWRRAIISQFLPGPR